MIQKLYIYHRNGSLRQVDKAVPDPTDPSSISTFYANFPPLQAVDFQVDVENEVVSTTPLTPQQVQAALAAIVPLPPPPPV